MQKITIECDGCAAQLELDPGFSGGVCRCAACGCWIDVPEVTGIPRFRRRTPNRPDAPATGPGAKTAPIVPAVPKPVQDDTHPHRAPGREPHLRIVVKSADALRLIVLDGPAAGTQVDLPAGNGCRICRRMEGRSDAPPSFLPLDDDTASHRHAVVRWQQDGWALADIGSRNGTFLNEKRIRAVASLGDGDVIRVGSTSIAVQAVRG